jgi:hypothetical protein
MKARVLGRCVTFNGSYAFLRPKQTDDAEVGAGMYAEPDTDSALAEGLRKFIRNQQ